MATEDTAEGATKAASPSKAKAPFTVQQDLVQLADRFVCSGGVISDAEAHELWEAALDGSGVTANEFQTLEQIMGTHKFTDKARAYLGRLVTNEKSGKSCYKVVDKVRYDRSCLDLAVHLAKDGKLDVGDAKQLWSDVEDGPGVTETEKRSIEYVMTQYTVTEGAKAFLDGQLAAWKPLTRKHKVISSSSSSSSPASSSSATSSYAPSKSATFSQEVQDSITAFVSKPVEEQVDLGPLIKVIQAVATTGVNEYEWESMKKLLASQLKIIVDEYAKEGQGQCEEVDGETFEVRYSRVLKYLAGFTRPPFTFQRMCELLVEPRRFYKNTDKFFHSFSKMVCGISAPMDLNEEDDVMDETMDTEEDLRPPVKKARLDSNGTSSSEQKSAGVGGVGTVFPMEDGEEEKTELERHAELQAKLLAAETQSSSSSSSSTAATAEDKENTQPSGAAASS